LATGHHIDNNCGGTLVIAVMSMAVIMVMMMAMMVMRALTIIRRPRLKFVFVVTDELVFMVTVVRRLSLKIISNQ
jgi:hypothetical protein